MSAGAQLVGNKIDILIDINKKMLAAMGGDKKGGDKAGAKKEDGPKAKIADDDAKKLTGLAGAVKDLVEAAKQAETIKPASATKIVKFYETFSKGISDALDKLDPKKAQEFGTMMDKIVGGASKLVKTMALTAILSPLAMIGSRVFGFIVKGLANTISRLPSMKATILKGLETLFGMAKGIAIFMLVMVGISLLAAKVAIGTLVFILVITGLSAGLRLVEKIGGDGTGFNKGPVGSLLKMGKAIAIFMLVMVGVGMLAQQVAIGALVFITVITGLSIGLRLVEKIGGDGTGFNKGPLGSLLKMGKAIAIFMLVLVGVGMLAQQVAIGALVFITVILGLSIALRIVAAIGGDGAGLNKGPLGALMKMGRSIALFALTLILIGLTAPLIAIGALVFILVIAALAISFRLVKAIVGDGKGLKSGALGSLLNMSKAIFIFSAVFILIGLFFVVPFAIGALVVILTIAALGFVLGKFFWDAKVKKGSLNLRHVSISLVIFAGAMLLWAVVAMVLTWEAIAMLGAVITVLGLAVYVLGKFDKQIKKGSLVLRELSISLVIFAAGMLVLSLAAKNLTWESIAMMGVVIVVLGLAAYALGIPAVFPFAELGAGVLVTLGAALLIFSIGFLIFATAVSMFKSQKQVEIMGSVIITLGMSLAAVGLISPFVILGSAAMVVAGVALVPISIGLAIFSAISWNPSKSKNLQGALNAIQLGMMGQSERPSGFWGWLKASANTVAMAITLTIASAAMIVAGAALVPISIGLAIFKATGWTVADSINLRFTLNAIGGAFADLARGGEWYYVMMGIFGMRDVGATLVGLAAGIQAMANMTFTEYEWDEKTKRLEPKRKVKLTRDDVKVAADNAAYTISVLAEPLAKFGRVMEGSAPPSDFFGIGKNSVEKGINALGSLGRGLVSMAQGVQDWATMSYWEYDLVMNPKTKMKELRPVKKRKITPAEIEEATKNIAYTISGMVAPLAQFGLLMAGGNIAGGPFAMLGISKNPIEKGIESLGTLGKSIVSLAQGVRDWATMSYWEYAVQMNPKTKMNELRASAKKKLTKGEIKEAVHNIAYTISAMVSPLAQWGTLMTAGNIASGPFVALGLSKSKNVIEKGIESLGTLGKSIGSLASGVLAFAKMSFIEFTVQKDPKTKLNVLTPSKVTKVGSADMKNALTNIVLVLSMLVTGIVEYTKGVNKVGGVGMIDFTLKSISKTQDTFISLFRKLYVAFADGKKIDLLNWNYKQFINGVLAPSNIETVVKFAQFLRLFNVYNNQLLILSNRFKQLDFSLRPSLNTNYATFATTTMKLAKIADPFTKFVKAFGDMAKHMGTFATNFKLMTPQGITAYKEWTDSMVTISQVDISQSQGIIGFVNGVVNAVTNAGNPPITDTDGDGIADVPPVVANGVDEVPKKPGKETTGNIDKGAITAAIISAVNAAFSNLTVGNINVKGDIIGG